MRSLVAFIALAAAISAFLPSGAAPLPPGFHRTLDEPELNARGLVGLRSKGVLDVAGVLDRTDINADATVGKLSTEPALSNLGALQTTEASPVLHQSKRAGKPREGQEQSAEEKKLAKLARSRGYEETRRAKMNSDEAYANNRRASRRASNRRSGQVRLARMKSNDPDDIPWRDHQRVTRAAAKEKRKEREKETRQLSPAIPKKRARSAGAPSKLLDTAEFLSWQGKRPRSVHGAAPESEGPDEATKALWRQLFDNDDPVANSAPATPVLREANSAVRSTSVGQFHYKAEGEASTTTGTDGSLEGNVHLSDSVSPHLAEPRSKQNPPELAVNKGETDTQKKPKSRWARHWQTDVPSNSQ